MSNTHCPLQSPVRFVSHVSLPQHDNCNCFNPPYLKVLFKPLLERIGYSVELDKLLNVEHLRVVSRGSGVKPRDHGAHVAENGGVHQG